MLKNSRIMLKRLFILEKNVYLQEWKYNMKVV